MATQASTNEEIDVVGYIHERTIIKNAKKVESLSDVSKGDHIIHCVTEHPYRPMFQSVLVIDSSKDEDTLSIIRNSSDGIEEKTFTFSSIQFPYKVVYDCTAIQLFNADEAIQRARNRQKKGETRDHYCPLFNNSHHFVTSAMSGSEDSLSDIIHSVEKVVESLKDDDNNSGSDSDDTDDDDFQDNGIDTEISRENQEQGVPDLDDVPLIVPVTDGSLHEGEEHIVINDVHNESQSSDQDTDTSYNSSVDVISQPVLQKKKVNNASDISRGDHIMEDSKHWLVENINNSKFNGYTTTTKGKVEMQSKSWNENMHAIIYPEQCSIDIDKALECAKEEMDHKSEHGYSSSDQFVTKMKCGTEYSIDESCLLSCDAQPVSYSRISPDTKVALGDHLLIKNRGHYSSVVVCSLTGKNILTFRPDIDGQMQIVVGSSSEIYRVNYSEHLPPNEVVRRAMSEEGMDILRNHSDPSCFVSWAIIGKEDPVDVDKIIKNNPQQIKHVPPLYYKCISSVDEIQPGDHLFVPYPGYRWHFMVTECNVKADNPAAFKTVYCLRSKVKEQVEILDPIKHNIFKILYSEQLPAEKAIKRARSLVGNHKYELLARLEFVRWAKTGSKEGLEVDFLTNISAPISRERITCFTQLNPGDYLVVEESKATPYHHYLVISIQSATECTVVESWRRSSPTEKSLQLSEQCYYKLEYSAGVCRPLEESIAIAQQFCQKKWSIIDSHSRQKFVNFLKTGDSSHKVDVNSLRHIRLELRTERVTDATQLCKGDHIVRPIEGKIVKFVPILSEKKHHIIVFNPENNSVIESKVKSGIIRKGQPVKHSINIFKEGREVFRVLYTERIDPEEGIQRCMQHAHDEESTSDASAVNLESDTTQMLRQQTQLDHDASEPERYRLFTNNCEHLAMLATIGRKLSIQVSKEMYEDLSQKVALPLVVHGSDVLTRNTSKGVLKATGKFVGSAAARAAARAAVKGSITGGAAESAETTVAGALSNAFKVGYPAAVTGASIGIVSGVAVAANAGIEGPMLVRGIYKLHRQKKFKKISKQAYKHGVTRASITRVSTFIGGSGGALIGQVVIPVPVLGAVVGGIAGTVTGKVAGHIGGKAIANAAFKDKIVDLPVIVVCDYDNLSELDV